MTTADCPSSYWLRLNGCRERGQFIRQAMAAEAWWTLRHPDSGAPVWCQALHYGDPAILVPFWQALVRCDLAHEMLTAEDHHGRTLWAYLLRQPYSMDWAPLPEGFAALTGSMQVTSQVWQDILGRRQTACNTRGEGLLWQLCQPQAPEWTWAQAKVWPQGWGPASTVAGGWQDWIAGTQTQQQWLGERLFDSVLLYLGSGGRSAILGSWLRTQWTQPLPSMHPSLRAALAVLEWVQVVQAPSNSAGWKPSLGHDRPSPQMVMARLDALMGHIHRAPMSWWETEPMPLEQALLEQQSRLRAQLTQERARACRVHLDSTVPSRAHDKVALRRL